MISLSGNLLFISFLIYLVAIIFWGGAIKQKDNIGNQEKWSVIGIYITIVGFLFQVGYFFTRWIGVGHAPVSNMFEFTTFFGMMLVLAFIILYWIYRVSVLGLFALPIAMLIIAYASMFPREVSPLIPSLQSYWLAIHVTTAALGEAILSVSFVAGLIYLLAVVDQRKKSIHTYMLEFVMFLLLCFVSFILVTMSFKIVDYTAIFEWINAEERVEEVEYIMPAIVVPNEATLLTKGNIEGILEVPPNINARKLNTVIWSFGIGVALYALLRIIARKRISASIQPHVKNMNPVLLDEIGYRAVTIGFPIFTLGALIFAMIWAQIAWTRFWSFDPKEVWALITWLFYAAFLHLRLSKGWQGIKSAWLMVIGFSIIMFNLIFVNLVIAGLHSYA